MSELMVVMTTMRGRVLIRPQVDIEHRFWSKVDRSDASGCWPWTGSRARKEYGCFGFAGQQNVRAHRLSLVLHLGRDIAPGLHVDHLCRNPPCVNPAHLEEVTPDENVRRGVSAEMLRARQRGKTHCQRQHPYDEENTYYTPKGYRACLACKRISKARPEAMQLERERSRRRYAARRALLAAADEADRRVSDVQ